MATHDVKKITMGSPKQVYILSELSSKYTDLLQTLTSHFREDPRILSDSETPFKKAYNEYKRSLEEGINCFKKYADGKDPTHSSFSRKKTRVLDEMEKISAINSAMQGFGIASDIEGVDALVTEKQETRSSQARLNKSRQIKKSRKRKKTRKRKKPISKSKKRNKSKRKKR